MKNTFYILFVWLSATVVGFAQPSAGSLDTSFGAAGIVTTQVSGTYNFGLATVVQPDGKIIAVGYAGEPSTYKAVVTRYNEDGTLDNAFGNAGQLIIPIGEAKSYITDVALQPDGKIILGAYTWDNVAGNFSLVRLNSDGTFDNSFGNKGVVIADSGGSDVAESLLILEDGKILLGGYSDDNFSVAKFNTDGSIDINFGENGWAITKFDDALSFIKEINLQSDGKIIMGGFILDNTNSYRIAAGRLNPDGSLDTTFGTQGKYWFNVGIGNDFAEGVVVLEDDKIILGGHTYQSSYPLKYNMMVVRLTKDGALDTSYGTDGFTTVAIVDGANYTRNMLLQPDGKVILVGFTVLGVDYNFAMARFNKEGNLDTTFGNGGSVNTDLNARDDYGNSLSLQPDGKIILVGNSYNAQGISEIVVARYHNNILGIKENIETVKVFQFYPNPVYNQLTVEFKNPSQNTQLEIFDALGKKVSTYKMAVAQQKAVLNLSHLSKGIYFLQIKNKAGEVIATQKIIKD